MELSRQAQRLWAKTPSRYGQEDDLAAVGESTWLSLAQHLRDAADVGERLVHQVLAPRIQQRIAGACGGDLRDAARLVGFLAGTHDLGKAELCFQSQIEKSADHGWLWEQVRSMSCCPQDPGWHPSPKPRHAEVSDVILRRELPRVFPSASRQSIVSLSSVAGCHHGTLSSLGVLTAADSRGYQIDRWLTDHGSAWQALWVEFVADIVDRTGARDVVSRVLEAGGLNIQDQFLLCGVVTMADWIASNQQLFPLTASGSHHSELSRADQAMEQLNLTRAWRATEGEEPPFRHRFGWPAGSELRPCQTAALQAARSWDGPSLFILEEEMGQGKTEAALLAAEYIAAKEGAGGVGFALPTMGTTDAMLPRFKTWVHSLAEGDHEESHSLFLGHSRSWLNPENMKLIRATRAVNQDPRRTSEAVVAHEWFTGKRGMLAEFTVTTVDQVLMMALSTRYVTMRHLGLAGKIVILDEVHAYDVYTTDYMARALTWLAAQGVTVILLSATLASGMRQQLEDAYADGLKGATEPQAVASAASEDVAGTQLGLRRGHRRRAREARARTQEVRGSTAPPSPRISVTGASGTRFVPVPPRSSHRNVQVQFMADDASALLHLLVPLNAHGGVVGIVCNTVQRAQETYDVLRDRFDDGVVSLHHSQFTAFDRMARDSQLVQELGPAATRSNGKRPGCRIVVGTQVLEQSLDVDFDLLVTDLAPTDSIAQRAGRLHRHHRPEDDRPHPWRQAAVYVRGVERSADVPAPDPGSATIYGDRVLLATMSVLAGYSGDRPWCLTHELENAVERTYTEDLPVPQGWREVYRKAEQKEKTQQQQSRKKAGVFQLTTPAASGGRLDTALGVTTAQDAARSDSSAAAHVRDIEPTLEVLLVQSRGGLIGPLPGALPDKYATEDWFLATTVSPPPRFARAIAMSSVRLPRWLVPPWRLDQAIAELETQGWKSWQEDFRLRGQLVVTLDEQLHGTILGRSFGYDERVGLYPVDSDGPAETAGFQGGSDEWEFDWDVEYNEEENRT